MTKNNAIPVKDIGSDHWFVSLLDLLRDKAKVLYLNTALQKLISIKLVEDKTSGLVSTFRDVGVPIFILTSRGGTEAYEVITLEQLKQVGVADALYQSDQNSRIPFKVDYEGRPNDREYAVYRNGVIFCHGMDKGECLRAFLKMMNRADQYIVMVDDNEQHLRRIEIALKNICQSFTGLHYTALAPRIADFKLKVALQYLPENFYVHLKPEEQVIVDELLIIHAQRTATNGTDASDETRHTRLTTSLPQARK